MRQVLKDIGIYVILLVIVSAGIWLYNRYKDDALDYSLDLIGGKLLGMVKDDQDRQTIAAMWSNFVDEFRDQKIDAQQVETVAANILNLSYNAATVTPMQVRAILRTEEIPVVSFTPPAMNVTGQAQSSAFALAIDSMEFDVEIEGLPPAVMEIPPPPPPQMEEGSKPPRHPRAPRHAEAAARLRAICEFNERMEHTLQASDSMRTEINRHMRFHFNDGIKIAIDPMLKERIGREEFAKLAQELKRLEKEKIVVWKDEYHKQMKKEMARVQQELKALEKLQGIENLKALGELKKLEALKELEARGYKSAAAKADSIRIFIKQEVATRRAAVKQN